MTQLIELTEGDYGYSLQITLYQRDDDTTVENLTTASSASMDITRLDETPIVQGATVDLTTPASGIVTITPEADWFTDANLGRRNHYLMLIKITYVNGQKTTFPVPVYIHRRN